MSPIKPSADNAGIRQVLTAHPRITVMATINVSREECVNVKLTKRQLDGILNSRGYVAAFRDDTNNTLYLGE